MDLHMMKPPQPTSLPPPLHGDPFLSASAWQPIPERLCMATNPERPCMATQSRAPVHGNPMLSALAWQPIPERPCMATHS
eukprot:236959-Chlamydomonas_euryale.AAC.2